MNRLRSKSKKEDVRKITMLSKLMGHAKEIITIDVYGDNQGIIADCVPEIADFMEEVMPGPETDDEFKEELLDIVIDTGEYLDEVS